MATTAQASPYLSNPNANADLLVISGTSYTISNADLGRTLNFTSASAVSVTVPIGLVPAFKCFLLRTGAGAVTVAAGTGVTVNVVAQPVRYAASTTLQAYAGNTFALG